MGKPSVIRSSGVFCFREIPRRDRGDSEVDFVWLSEQDKSYVIQAKQNSQAPI